MLGIKESLIEVKSIKFLTKIGIYERNQDNCSG